MRTWRGETWSALLVGGLLLGCGDTPYTPTPERLLGEFSGRAGSGFETYDLFLAVDQVSDSVRGLWSLSSRPRARPTMGP